MTAMPASVKILLDGLQEEMEPSIERTEMERGIPKQRVVNSHVLASLSVGLYFPTIESATEFDTWYLTTIRRIGWFDFVHPRTGATLTVRFKGGAVGALAGIDEYGLDSRRQVVLEYLR